MLTVTARTAGQPLVMANLLTVTTADQPPDLRSDYHKGCVSGSVNGIPFAFSTAPGKHYTVGEFTSDALALSWTGETVFAACCATLERNGNTLLRSEEPTVKDIPV
jgi:hypothetical protein